MLSQSKAVVRERRLIKETYEPALMMAFMSKSALLMLATHITMQTTPAHAAALTCMHASQLELNGLGNTGKLTVTHPHQLCQVSQQALRLNHSHRAGCKAAMQNDYTLRRSAAMPKPIDSSNSAPGVWSSAVGGSTLKAFVSFGRLGSPETYKKVLP